MSDQITGKLKQAAGTVESAIGSITSPSLHSTGEQHKSQGKAQTTASQSAAASEANYDRAYGKLQSAIGMVTGDSDKQNEGNLRTEKAEWKKSVEGEHQLPEVSKERMQAKMKSAEGMVKGDQGLQKEGNLEAEKAEWLHG